MRRRESHERYRITRASFDVISVFPALAATAVPEPVFSAVSQLHGYGPSAVRNRLVRMVHQGAARVRPLRPGLALPRESRAAGQYEPTAQSIAPAQARGTLPHGRARDTGVGETVSRPSDPSCALPGLSATSPRRAHRLRRPGGAAGAEDSRRRGWSYHSGRRGGRIWWAQPDLNRRPADYESAALTN